MERHEKWWSFPYFVESRTRKMTGLAVVDVAADHVVGGCSRGCIYMCVSVCMCVCIYMCV